MDYYNHVFIPGFATSLPLPAGELNWHPTVDMKVQSYALEQSTKQIINETDQLRKENARLAAINSRLDRFEQEHFSSLNQALSTGDSSAS